MDGGDAVPDEGAADGDGALDVGRREVADRPAVRAAALALQLRDGLHGAHLRGAAHRSRREDGANGIEGVQAVGKPAVDLGDEMHHVRVALDVAQRGDLDGGRRRDAADVVARQVDEHGVLGELLRVGPKLLLQRGILDRVLVARPRSGDRPRDDLAVADADQQLRRGADHRRARRDRGKVEVVQVRRRVDPAQGPIDLDRASPRRHAEAAGEHRLEHLAGVDLLDQARDAGLVPGTRLRIVLDRHDGSVEGRRHLALSRRLQRPHDIGQPVSRADAVERRHARHLCQVVEHDHRRRQVEDGIRHGERIRFRHRHALPAGGCLVGQVADARCEREGRIAGHRLDDGKGRAEHLERIVTALHDERSALDPGDRVAAVSGTALDALEQEGAARAEAQRGGNRRERVGRQLDAGDAGRCCGGHRSCSGYNEASIRSGTEACSAVPPLVRT